MADRYWVGGTGTWDASSTTRWSLTSGGATGASAPTSTDDVFIDANSGTGTITCTSAVCNDLTVTAPQALTLGVVFSTLEISGNLTLPSGGSFQIFTSNAWTITLNRTSGTQVITTNGKLLCLITQNGPGGTVQFPAGTTQITNTSAPNTAIYTLTAGTLDLGTNNAILSCGGWSSSNSNTRSVAFGTGNITVNNGGGFQMTFTTNFTYTGAPTVNISSASSGIINARFTQTNALDFNITTGSYTMSINPSYVFRSLNFTGFTGTWTPNSGTFYGNLTLASGMTFNTPTSNTFTFAATSGTQVITSAGKTLGSIIQNGTGGTVSLADNLTLGLTRTYTLTAGTLDLNTFALSTGLFSSNLSNTRAILFGTSSITTMGSGTAFNMVGTSFTYTGTPTINISNNSATATTVTSHTSGGTEDNTLNFNITTGTYAFTLGSASRVKSLNFTGFTGSWSPGTAAATFYGNVTLVPGMTFTPGTAAWTFAATLGTQALTSAGKTLGPITQNGVGGTLQLSANTTLSTISTYTLTNGTLDLGTNTATFSVGLFSSDNSNTRVIYFGTGNITTTGSGTAFTTSTAVNLTYIGTPTVNISNNSATTTTVTAHITGGTEANVFNFNVTTGTYSLGLTSGSLIKSLNFTGFTGSWSTTSIIRFYGDLTLVPGMTFTGNNSDFSFQSSSATQTITSAGKVFGVIGKGGLGGTFTLADDLTTRILNVSSGTFNANDKNITISQNFNSSGTTARVINMGSGYWTFNSTVDTTIWNVSSSATLNAGTSTIRLQNPSTSTTLYTFTGGGLTYNNIEIGSPSTFLVLFINGSNTFNTISSLKTVFCRIYFLASTTNTITTLSTQGTSGNLFVLSSSSTGGVTATLSVTNPFTSDYTTIQDLILTNSNGTITNGYVRNNSTGFTLGPGTKRYDVITSGVSWAVPAGFKSTNEIHVIGSGGGGSGTSIGVVTTDRVGGAGGGGAGYAKLINQPYAIGTVIPLTIGLPGSGASDVNGGGISTGGTGGTTLWDNTVTITGGTGGISSAGLSTTPGSGGVASGGTLNYSGGNGGTGGVTTLGTNGVSGGGGGGAAGPFGAGLNGGNGITNTGSSFGGGGGGGPGGGSVGSIGTTTIGGDGGNNAAGNGGGRGNTANGREAYRGGGTAGIYGNFFGFNTNIAITSIDIAGVWGPSGGNGGGGINRALLPNSTFPYQIGSGGGGGGVSSSGGGSSGVAGTSGLIVIIWERADAFTANITENINTNDLKPYNGWFKIDTNQLSSWDSINDNQSAGWNTINSSQIGSWNNVDNTSGTAWDPINNNNSAPWDPINNSQ